MAYVHCHACKWGQDDFWSRSYNPLRCLLRDIHDYARPRMTKGGVFGRPMHTWSLLCWSVYHKFLRVWGMRWWTERAYRNACFNGTAVCPRCGNRKLCVD